MHVLITGGTGFVGVHTVAAVLTAGHRVRLLVRDPARVVASLRLVGLAPDACEVVVGDATDPGAVAAAVAGCDALVHAAGLYSFDSRVRAAMTAANVRATEVVLGAGVAAGLDPVVHVSTFGALLPARTPAGERPPVLTTRSPAGDAREPYLASKARAEAVARRLQDAGAPVVITYPAASIGPGDPGPGDQLRRIRDVLRGLMPLWPDGGFPVGDVRDVARLHAALLRPGLGPRRCFGPGRFLTTRAYLDTLRVVTGRRLPTLHLSAAALLPVGAAASAAQRVLPLALPVAHGAVYLCRHALPVDDGDARELLGGPARPVESTMADAVHWLYTTGRLTRRQAGLAAHARTPRTL